MKFTKASKGDGTKVTTNVSGLYEFLTTNCSDPLTVAKIMKDTRFSGAQFLIEVEGIPTVFTVNRAGETLATKAFPPSLKRPNVGHARNYTVTGVSVITNSTGVLVG